MSNSEQSICHIEKKNLYYVLHYGSKYAIAHIDELTQFFNHYPCPHGLRGMVLCVCLSVYYHKIAINFNYLKI